MNLWGSHSSRRSIPSRVLSVKRTHGLGNVIMLLPVLEQMAAQGMATRLVTRPEWAEALSLLCPSITFAPYDEVPDIDLDTATRDVRPQEHRTLEFGKILKVAGPFRPVRFHVPEHWKRSFRSYSGAVLFGPEAGHPARVWPEFHVYALCRLLEGRSLVLVGLNREPFLPCDADLRGKLSLKQLLGLVSVARCMICLDSGLLQVALAVGVPALALFGGIDPSYRIFAQQKARVLRVALDCSPCNKQETCQGAYFCMKELLPERVAAGLETLSDLKTLEIREDRG